MKNITFYLCVLIVILGLPNKTYSAKDTLPPNPVFQFCYVCGGTHDNAYVEDMPRTYERSRLDSIILHKESYNYDFTYEDFIPGKDYRTKWYAKVHDFRNDAYIKITFKDVAGNDTIIENYYNATKISVRPNLDFGLLSVGDSKELDCWIINEASISDTITIIRFRLYDYVYKIDYVTLPVIIGAGDSIKCKVRFTAYTDGVFDDSVGVGTYRSIFYYLASVKAYVGSPRIDVSNYNFGSVNVNSSSNCAILIRNLGKTELVITGIAGPNQPTVFIPYLFGLSEENPIRIPPNQDYSVEIMFIPSAERIYFDTIFFISNTEKIDLPDSIAELYGRGVPIAGIDESVNGNEITLAPNPADDFLTINFKDDARKPDYLRLIDAFGNLVFENRIIIENNLKINTSELPSGMYFLRIGNVGTWRVVVMH